MTARPKYRQVLTTADDLDTWCARLGGITPLAVDTETTGLDWWVDRVGGLALAANQTAVFAVRGALGGMVRWLATQVKHQRPLVFHNAKFDLHMLRATFGLHVAYPVDDTMLMSFLLDNRGTGGIEGFTPGHGLKGLAQAFVDPAARDPQARLLAAIKTAGGRNVADWLLAPLKLSGTYAAMDAWYTLQLRRQFVARIVNWPQPGEDVPPLWSLYETERWLILALRDMEHRGIMANAEFLSTWRDALKVKLEHSERQLRKFAGRDCNWNSAPQLREIIYGKFKQPVAYRTPGGEPSTAEAALKSMTHPFARQLLNYREDFKQYTSYAVNLLASIRSDGAIHPKFKQMGAETGRMSCEDPNLQQQTRESGVRKAYHPRKGLALRFADYSQVEMRFAAHLANEPTLIEGFNHDPDFDTHRATAQLMYGVQEPTSRQRKFGKIINFTTLFGGGENKVTEQLIDLISVEDARAGCREFKYRPGPGESPHRALAQLILQRYYAELPAMRKATRQATRLAESRGMTLNLFGRHRYIDERWYRAFNTEVQGSAADQAKRGLVALYRELQLGDGALALILQIHDEAVYESDGDPAVDRRVLELLADTTRFKVPIIADVSGSTTTWQDKVKLDL